MVSADLDGGDVEGGEAGLGGFGLDLRWRSCGGDCGSSVMMAIAGQQAWTDRGLVEENLHNKMRDLS